MKRLAILLKNCNLISTDILFEKPIRWQSSESVYWPVLLPKIRLLSFWMSLLPIWMKKKQNHHSKTLRKLAKEQNKKLFCFSSHDWRLAKEFTDKIWYVKENHLYSGIVEDILLQHNELTNASLFQINETFIPPVISAPQFHKEMLYSLLQKTSKRPV